MTGTKSKGVTALASWFGSNRTLAPQVGRELSGCQWVGVAFAGGMSEVPHIEARTVNLNDVHRHVMNLAKTAAHPSLGPALYRRLKRLVFHPYTLQQAQERCRVHDDLADDGDELFASGFRDQRFDPGPDLGWAVDYFVCAWMSRHASAGRRDEFSAPISTRWNASGGDSAAHFFSAVGAITQMRRTLRRCNFTSLDFRDFLAKCKDRDGHGVYADPPFPGPGDDYKHSFTEKDHRDLARLLSAYTAARVVCRFYDHPMIRELYPESRWTWRRMDGGRKQTNGDAPEVLLINGASLAIGGAA